MEAGVYKILVKFASRSRPNKFFASLDNIQHLIEDKENYKILCALDLDDERMNDPDVINRLATYTCIEVAWGRSKNKIDAINRDIKRVQEFDILVNMSDDMVWGVKGFDNVIREDFKRYFPDTDGVLHYNDGTPAGDKIMTMSILGRKYYERDNYIYNPEYISLWSDNEATEVAKLRNKYQYIGQELFKHFHPGWGLAKYDDQYRKTESLYHVDKITYDKRKSLNFGI